MYLFCLNNIALFAPQILLILSVGELICPAYHELCSTGTISVFGQCPNSCNFNGDCVDGKCHCFLGFHGHDCNKRELLSPFHSTLVSIQL